jgi:hypothetical protein
VVPFPPLNASGRPDPSLGCKAISFRISLNLLYRTGLDFRHFFIDFSALREKYNV